MMTTKQTLQATADKLRADADRLSAQAAEALDRVRQVDAEKAAIQAERQAAADRQAIAAYRAAGFDEDVEQARRALDQTVRESAIAQALGRYLSAQESRYEAFHNLMGARARLGMTVEGAQPPPVGGLAPVTEYVAAAARNIAGELSDVNRTTAINNDEETS